MLNLQKPEWVLYTPAYNGNRDSDDPMTVEIHPLSHGEVVKYTDSIHAQQRPGFKGQIQSNASSVQRRQFKDNIRDPKNIIGLSGSPVTTAEQLYDDVPFDLVKELIDAMEDISRLSDGEIKNSV